MSKFKIIKKSSCDKNNKDKNKRNNIEYKKINSRVKDKEFNINTESIFAQIFLYLCLFTINYISIISLYEFNIIPTIFNFIVDSIFPFIKKNNNLIYKKNYMYNTNSNTRDLHYESSFYDSLSSSSSSYSESLSTDSDSL